MPHDRMYANGYFIAPRPVDLVTKKSKLAVRELTFSQVLNEPARARLYRTVLRTEYGYFYFGQLLGFIVLS